MPVIQQRGSLSISARSISSVHASSSRQFLGITASGSIRFKIVCQVRHRNWVVFLLMVHASFYVQHFSCVNPSPSWTKWRS
jgi:hypothetical protein